jgi:hypothetical protein
LAEETPVAFARLAAERLARPEFSAEAERNVPAMQAWIEH